LLLLSLHEFLLNKYTCSSHCSSSSVDLIPGQRHFYVLLPHKQRVHSHTASVVCVCQHMHIIFLYKMRRHFPRTKECLTLEKAPTINQLENFHFHFFLNIRVQCFSLKTLVESVKNTCCVAYISGKKITNNNCDN